ncbi:MAG TPA: hypothetical protein VIK01_05275, partial [Polyangiaceae bacterium]
MATHDSGGAGAGRGKERIDRRSILKALAISTVLLDGCSDREAAVAVRQHGIGTAEAEESPIRIENRLPGDR